MAEAVVLDRGEEIRFTQRPVSWSFRDISYSTFPFVASRPLCARVSSSREAAPARRKHASSSVTGKGRSSGNFLRHEFC